MSAVLGNPSLGPMNKTELDGLEVAAVLEDAAGRRRASRVSAFAFELALLALVLATNFDLVILFETGIDGCGEARDTDNGDKCDT